MRIDTIEDRKDARKHWSPVILYNTCGAHPEAIRNYSKRTTSRMIHDVAVIEAEKIFHEVIVARVDTIIMSKLP